MIIEIYLDIKIDENLIDLLLKNSVQLKIILINDSYLKIRNSIHIN